MEITLFTKDINEYLKEDTIIESRGAMICWIRL